MKSSIFKVYVHKPRDKMWIALGYFVMNVPRVTLVLGNETELITLGITEKRTTVTNKDFRPCNMYKSEDGFMECSKSFFSTYFESTLNCTIPGNNKNNPFK